MPPEINRLAWPVSIKGCWHDAGYAERDTSTNNVMVEAYRLDDLTIPYKG